MFARKKIILIMASLLISATSTHAQPNQVLYDLQERCGRQAAQTFAREWGANAVTYNDGSSATANYENHYSARLNKCFYLEISEHYPKGNLKPTKTLRLFDLNENKEYGTFSRYGAPGQGQSFMTCEVRDRRCDSEAEWRALAKPFLEE